MRSIGRLVMPRIKMAHDRHWWEWLEQIDREDVWTAWQLMKSVSSDGSRTRILDLRRGRGVGEEVATTNRSKWLVGEFYLKQKSGATDPAEDTEYPEPMWKYAPLSEQILHQVAVKMKLWKATHSGTFPNCLYKFCTALFVPRLCKIYRALEAHQHEPPDWNRTETFVARKPGKPDYSQAGSHRPLILSHRHARFRNRGKTLQLATIAQRYNMLPSNHYGGQPGRMGLDMVQGIVKKVKDAWCRSKVATLLRDVKGAFPSAMISRMVHNMRMAGVPREHTDWMQHRFTGCTT
jgi:hypothetical protein